MIMDREHTSKHYEQQLRELKDKLLLMSHKAEQMISDSIRSLVDRRPTLAAKRLSSATMRSISSRLKSITCATRSLPSSSRWRGICGSSQRR